MASFDIATGYVKFKGNLDEFDQDIAKANKKLKDMQEATGIGANRLRMGATESARIAKEMAQAAKESRKIMDLVTLGKFGVMVRDLKSSLNTFAASATKFGVGATAIGGAALASGAAGSPLAQSTLEGSFKLLATTIGGTFTPLVKDASRGLQQLAKTWNGISDSTKNLISEGAKFIGIAGLAALGLAAIAKGLLAIAAHPVIAALSGVAAGAMFLENQKGQQQKDVAGAQARIFATTKEQALKSQLGQEFAAMTPEEAKKASLENMAQKRENYEAARRAHEESATGFAGFGNRLIGGGNEAKLREKVERKGILFEESKFLANEFGGAKLEKRKEGAKSKDDMLLGSPGPASMVGVAELFKSFQLAGASGNQLEAENKKKELENQQKLLTDNSVEQTRLLRKIANEPNVVPQ